jgi:hypothetical protein
MRHCLYRMLVRVYEAAADVVGATSVRSLERGVVRAPLARRCVALRDGRGCVMRAATGRV